MYDLLCWKCEWIRSFVSPACKHLTIYEVSILMLINWHRYIIVSMDITNTLLDEWCLHGWARCSSIWDGAMGIYHLRGQHISLIFVKSSSYFLFGIFHSPLTYKKDSLYIVNQVSLKFLPVVPGENMAALASGNGLPPKNRYTKADQWLLKMSTLSALNIYLLNECIPLIDTRSKAK